MQVNLSVSDMVPERIVVSGEVWLLRVVNIIGMVVPIRVFFEFKVGILREEVPVENTLPFIAKMSMFGVGLRLHASI